MHEYSIADQLVTSLEEQVDEDQLRNTRVVHIRLGELRMLSQEALRKAYQIITEDTVLSGSSLEFETVPVAVTCSDCDYSGPVDYDRDLMDHYSIPMLSCPECGGRVTVDSGRELEVRSLTVEEEQPPAK